MIHALGRLLTVGALSGTVAIAGIGTASAKSSIDFHAAPRTQHVGQWFNVNGSGRADVSGWERFCVQERYNARGAWSTVWCGRISDSTRQDASAYGRVRAGHAAVLELRGVLEGVQHAWGGRTWLDAESAPVRVNIVH